MIAELVRGAGPDQAADPDSYARATLNLLEDFDAERVRLADVQTAMLNLLDDIDAEKSKGEQANREMAREIAERQQAQETLKHALAEVARSNAELEQFAYIASHDLQEPLRMVSSYVQLLEKRYKDKLDKDANEFIAFAVNGAARMQEMVLGLLAYSRVGTRGKSIERTESEGALTYAIENLQVAISQSGAVITHDALPAVMADESLLTQVFQNLIGNALKFRGEAPPRIHVSATRDEQEWVFSVRDNGIGIDPKYMGKLFVLFSRLHGHAKYPGTGIGLAVCKRVVAHHGGRIWVESEPGKGSIFYFTVPMRGGVEHESGG